MNASKEQMYVIPDRFRKMENMHILFWLMKDVSWCLVWKALGVAMIIPTLLIAIIIAWRTRNFKSELAHNLAIIFWITANAYWMISEFFGFDTIPVWHQFEGKHLAIIPFSIGVLILANYYLFQRKNKEKEERLATQ